MNLTFNYFQRFALALCTVLLTCTIPYTSPSPMVPDADDLFKGFDFDAFLSELEQALAEDDDTKNSTSSSRESKKKSDDNYSPYALPPTSSDNTTTVSITIESNDDQSRDSVSLFKNPSVQTIQQKSGKKTTEPTPTSLNAYETVMSGFIASLNAVRQKIAASGSFSPLFKEACNTYVSNIIDYITVAYEQIKSKKVYKCLFLAPHKSNKQLVTDMQKLRTMIIEVAEKLHTINQKITISAADEEKESHHDLLQELASKPLPEHHKKTSTRKDISKKSTSGHQPSQSHRPKPKTLKTKKGVDTHAFLKGIDNGIA